MTTLLKTDFSDAQVLPTDDPQWDKLVLPAGEIPIMYEAGTPEDRSANVVDGQTLQFELRNATIPGDRAGYYKGRVQLNVGQVELKEATIRTSIFLDPDAFEAYRDYPKANSWFTIAELWCGAASSMYPFRISLNLAKHYGAGNPVYFLVAASQKSAGTWETVWTRESRIVRPEFGELFGLDLSYRQGNYRTGKFGLSMNGMKIFDITNSTYHRNSPMQIPLTMIQPCKLYTSGAVIDHMRDAGQPARILWDNLEIST